MANRILVYSEVIQDKLDKLSPDKIAALEESMALTFKEHYAYQNKQAEAHVMGKISLDEAQTMYMALGEVGNAANGYWAKGTSLALKVTITKLIGELMGVK